MLELRYCSLCYPIRRELSLAFYEHLPVRRRPRGAASPITIGRPAYAVTCGSFRLIVAARELGPLRRFVRPHLRGVEEAAAPEETVREGKLDGPTLLVNARLVPSLAALAKLHELIAANREGIVETDGSVAAAVVKRAIELPPFGDGAALPAIVRKLELPAIAAELPLFEYPHDIIRYHLASLRENLEHRLRDGCYREVADGVFVGDGRPLGEYVVTDTRGGPIVLDDDASIGPYCYLSGPVYVGPRRAGHRARGAQGRRGDRPHGQGRRRGRGLDHRALHQQAAPRLSGPQLPGKLDQPGRRHLQQRPEEHLRPVNMEYHGQKVRTGMQFVGAIIGDYAKTAINTGIFTGKTIGACSMVYGFVTTNVPSFVNYARLFGQVTEAPVEVMMATQARMFERRGVAQRPCDVQLLHDMYELTRAERANSGEPLSLEPLSL